MKIEITGAMVNIHKEESDKRFKNDSQFFYALRNALRAQGRDERSAGLYCMHDRNRNGSVNFRCGRAYNKDGSVNFRLERQ